MTRQVRENMLVLCIDECRMDDLVGRVYSPMRKEVIHFHDASQMILQIDALFDSIGYPQSYQTKRSFHDQESMFSIFHKHGKPVHSDEELLDQRGSFCTYILCVESRLHTTWQGSLFSMKLEKLVDFKDVLSLLQLLISRIEVTEGKRN